MLVTDSATVPQTGRGRPRQPEQLLGDGRRSRRRAAVPSGPLFSFHHTQASRSARIPKVRLRERGMRCHRPISWSLGPQTGGGNRLGARLRDAARRNGPPRVAGAWLLRCRGAPAGVRNPLAVEAEAGRDLGSSDLACHSAPTGVRQGQDLSTIRQAPFHNQPSGRRGPQVPELTVDRRPAAPPVTTAAPGWGPVEVPQSSAARWISGTGSRSAGPQEPRCCRPPHQRLPGGLGGFDAGTARAAKPCAALPAP